MARTITTVESPLTTFPSITKPPSADTAPAQLQTVLDALVVLPGQLNTLVATTNAAAADLRALADDVTADADVAATAAGASQAQADRSEAQADQAQADAGRAKDYADAAKSLAGTGITGTSTSSLTLGAGNRTMTVETGRAFVAGARVELCSTADPVGRRMSGPVQSYNATTGALTVAVDTVTGSGTYASWSARIVPEVATSRTTYLHFLVNS